MLQVVAEPPDDIEPAVVMFEAPWHRRVANVALGLEPRRISLLQSA
jgi:hypothetical protein